MPRRPPRNAYTVALRAARARTHVLGREGVARLRQNFADAAARLASVSSESALVAGRAAALRRNMLGTLAGLEKTVGTVTEGTVRLTVTEVARIHAEATRKLYLSAGLEAPSAAVASRFSSVPVRALAALNAKHAGAATFQTLYHRHMQHAAGDLDRIIGSAIARGAPANVFAKDVAALLLGEDVDTALYGLHASDVTGLRTLWYDARRIAVSETNNAHREASNMALVQTGIIAAAKWQLSGRHEGLKSSPDECDELAEADEYGYGPGYYPPEEWPDAPHPFCGCTQGGPVVYKDPDEWPDLG